MSKFLNTTKLFLNLRSEWQLSLFPSSWNISSVTLATLSQSSSLPTISLQTDLNLVRKWLNRLNAPLVQSTHWIQGILETICRHDSWSNHITYYRSSWAPVVWARLATGRPPDPDWTLDTGLEHVSIKPSTVSQHATPDTSCHPL